MTNKELRADVKTARYELEPLDAARIERTLSRLPKRRQRNIWDKFAVAVPVAAAIMVFIIFAMPPIVEAVGALVERIFEGRVEQIEQYEALPDEERIAVLAGKYESYYLTNEIEGAEADFEGVKITVSGIRMWPEHNIEEKEDGWINVILGYSEVPTFDPNWIDFTLRYDGASHPVNDRLISYYREQGFRAMTGENWLDDDLNWYSHTHLEDGVLTTTELEFEVDRWRLSKKTDMVLEGSMDGKRFEIMFSFDPEKAHEESTAMAAELLKEEDQNIAETRDQLRQYADAAVPVGAKGDLAGMEFSIAEIALTGSKLHLSASVSGIMDDLLAHVSTVFWINGMYVDGNFGWANLMDNKKLEDDVYTFTTHFDVEKLLPRLPEESLICVKMVYHHMLLGVTDWDTPGIEDYGYAAFKYNWTTKIVTLPKDDAEREEWITASGAKE